MARRRESTRTRSPGGARHEDHTPLGVAATDSPPPPPPWLEIDHVTGHPNGPHRVGRGPAGWLDPRCADHGSRRSRGDSAAAPRPAKSPVGTPQNSPSGRGVHRAGGGGVAVMGLMDGQFVPNLTSPRRHRGLRPHVSLPFEANYVNTPEVLLERWGEPAATCCRARRGHHNLHRCLESCARTAPEMRVALQPVSPVSAVEHGSTGGDGAGLTVKPGFGGQAYMPHGARSQSCAARMCGVGRDVDIEATVASGAPSPADGGRANVLVAARALRDPEGSPRGGRSPKRPRPPRAPPASERGATPAGGRALVALLD